MSYKPEHAAHFAEQYPPIRDRLEWLNAELLVELTPTLTVDKAREYLQHGVCRRVKTIRRCLVNVFTIYPPERTAPLPSDDVSDVMINVQAFIANVYGAFDNVAWVYILEQGRESTIGRQAIGLFDRRTQAHLSTKMREYLGEEHMQAWFADYSKNFRDALGHRIPPYVPPFMTTSEERNRWTELDAQILPAIREHRFEDMERIQAERDAIGKAAPVFRHSFSDADGERAVMLHPQMLTDAMTITELLETVKDDVKANGWGNHSPTKL